MSVKHNAINRSIASLGLGVVREVQRKEAARANIALRERTLQFQLPISGYAGPSLATGSIDLTFESPFYYAPGNRDSDYDRPHFSLGVVLTGDTFVVIPAAVTSWERDPSTDGVTGATVTVGVFVPGADQLTQFSGFIDLSFQGYAGLTEDETEI